MSSVMALECCYKGQQPSPMRRYTPNMALIIKQLRVERGLSQLELAERAGVSRSQLSQIETETRPANTLRLAAIARALGVDVEDLFSSPGTPDDRDVIFKLMGIMSEDDRKALLHLAKSIAAKYK